MNAASQPAGAQCRRDKLLALPACSRFTSRTCASPAGGAQPAIEAMATCKVLPSNAVDQARQATCKSALMPTRGSSL